MKIFLLFFTAFTMSLSISSQNQLNITDAKGKKQGLWIKRDPKDLIQYMGYFKDDKPTGTFRYYYPYADTIVRTVLRFQPNGKEAWAQNYHLSKLIASEGKFIEQKKDSIWKFYSEEGFLICKEYYKNDKKNGLSVNFYPSGQIFNEVTYKDDLKNGKSIEYYENGKTKSEGNWVNGQQEGKSTHYFPSGTIAASGIYRQGKKHLVWIYNSSDNKPQPREVYNMGTTLEGEAAEKFLKEQKNKTATTSPAGSNKSTDSKSQSKATPAAKKK